jgi:hypothetical protein
MSKLLEQAIAEIASLPEDQQEAVAAHILEEVRRRTTARQDRGKWARVADHLARLDVLRGKSERFVRHTREFRDGFRLRGRPNP